MQARRVARQGRCIWPPPLVVVLVIVACGVPFSASATGPDETPEMAAASFDPGISEDAMILATRLHQALSDDMIMDASRLEELAREIDPVLTRIRIHDPRMSEISARQWHRPGVLLLELEGDLLDVVMDRWQDGRVASLPRTGHAAFDELGARVGLDRVDTSPGSSMVIVSVSDHANMRAVQEAYAAINGVRHAERDGFLGGGPDILATHDGGAWYVTMRNAWGDCPSGCMFEEAFHFIVSPEHLEQVEASEADGIEPFRNLLAAPR